MVQFTSLALTLVRHNQLDHLMRDGMAAYICDEYHSGDETS